MDMKEKAAYLKGLAEGLNYDKTTAEGKLLTAIIDLLGEIAEEVEGTQQDVDYLNEYVDEIDKDLGDVEEAVFGDDEFDGDYDEDEEGLLDGFEDEDLDDNGDEDPEN